MNSTEYKAGAPAGVSARMGAGSWAILVVLSSLLAATFIIAYLGWTNAKDADVPISGYIAMAIGVIFSLAVGFGLMALIFFSSRKGYDEPPVLILPANVLDIPESSPEKSEQ